MKHYFIRLDDACSTMDHEKWNTIERILDKYNIFPMVGIVPKNEDPKLIIDVVDEGFWEKARFWQKKGWAIALHGYNHVCCTTDAGINPLWNRSEFAGLSLEKQRDKIKKGMAIFEKENLIPQYFFAPSHTYDMNTLQALKVESSIRIISDTISFHSYTENGFTFLPVQFGSFRNILISGTWTFCFHPNTMNEKQILGFEDFIRENRIYFSSFKLINFPAERRKSFVDKLISKLYFSYRRLR